MATSALRPDSVRANPKPASSESNGDTTRRRALATLFATPALALVPPLIACSRSKVRVAVTPFRTAHVHYIGARDRFRAAGRAGMEKLDNAQYDRIEREYLAALTALDTTPCADWKEFVDAMDVAYEDGIQPPGVLALKLLADARRLHMEGC